MTKKILKALIIEDEIESAQLLITLINSTGLATVTNYSTDPDKALQLIKADKPDILFLDIRMPGKSGFDLLDDIRKSGVATPFVVFVTAYDNFAVRAFDYAAFDYLLKPVDPQRLAETLRRCREMQEKNLTQPHEVLISTYRKLLFKNNTGMIFIDPEDILYVQAEGNYSVFNLLSGKKEIITILIGKVEEQLPADKFFRISRSFIINLRFIKKVNTRLLQCILSYNGKDHICDISREKISELSGMIRSN